MLIIHLDLIFRRDLMMSLKIREYRESDFEAVHQFITQTWYADSHDQDPNVTDAFINVDVNSHLHKSTFGLTAELDGEVVGVLLGNIKDEPYHMRLYKKEIVPELQKFFQSDQELSKELITAINKEHEANDKLNEQLKDPYQGKVQLFIVDSSKRGQNIGGTLWNAGQKKMAKAGVERFILHTDSNCDFSYYDALGMSSLDPIEIESSNDSTNYMLYHGEVKPKDKAE